MKDVTFKPFIISFYKINLLRDMLVLEVKPSEELLKLQKELHEILEAKGFELETRPYYPHITLIRKYHGSIVPFSPVKQQVQGFHLYSSSRINGVLTYTVIATAKSQ
jgi:2'-5' RNA ligase